MRERVGHGPGGDRHPTPARSVRSLRAHGSSAGHRREAVFELRTGHHPALLAERAGGPERRVTASSSTSTIETTEHRNSSHAARRFTGQNPGERSAADAGGSVIAATRGSSRGGRRCDPPMPADGEGASDERSCAGVAPCTESAVARRRQQSFESRARARTHSTKGHRPAYTRHQRAPDARIEETLFDRGSSAAETGRDLPSLERSPQKPAMARTASARGTPAASEL